MSITTISKEPLRLSRNDLSAIVFDLRGISVFFEKPILVQFGESGNYYSESIGYGYGGLSGTIWTRSTMCLTGCGRCCRTPYRNVWYYYSSETNRPDGLIDFDDITIDGKRIRLHLDRQDKQPEENCSHLVTKDVGNGVLGDVCGIYEQRPAHCRQYPELFLTHSRGRLWWSRRLPSRNWGFPKCPIEMSTTMYTPETRDENVFIFDMFARALSFDRDAHRVAKRVVEFVKDPPKLAMSTTLPIGGI